jgi:O-antigen ligase
MILIGRKKMTSAKFVGLTFILLLITPLILTAAFKILIEYSSSIYASSKLEGLTAVIADGENVSDVTSRSDLIRLSINSFLENPIFGAGAWYSDGTINKIGQHSQILDELGRYGLFGFIALFTFVNRVFSKLLRYNSSIAFYENLAIPSFTIFFALSFLNPVVTIAILYSILIVMPPLVRYKNEDYIYN